MKFLRVLGSEIVLGTLIAILSVFTAVASYQGALAGGEQNNQEVIGMQKLNDGNAEYLRSNQDITQDYNYFDNWYLNANTNPDVAEYYKSNFSQQLQDAIARDPNTVWDDQYYTDMQVDSTALFDESDAAFEKASNWNERGDNLQLVMTIMAIGLAFAAWASLLKEESNMRVVFAIFSVLVLIYGIITYLGVPTVV